MYLYTSCTAVTNSNSLRGYIIIVPQISYARVEFNYTLASAFN